MKHVQERASCGVCVVVQCMMYIWSIIPECSRRENSHCRSHHRASRGSSRKDYLIDSSGFGAQQSLPPYIRIGDRGRVDHLA